MMTIFSRLGALRMALLLIALSFYPMAWFADSEPEGFGVITAYITFLVVMLFFVLLLDALMNRLFMADKEGEARQVARTRMWLDLLVFIGLVLIWSPYFYGIGSL